MGEFSTLMARDGHEFQAYLAAPANKTRGGIVVIQEIFGVNSHIRAVTDSFAAEGYTAIAPALFDRVRRGIELGYAQTDMQEGRGYVQQLKQENTLLDLGAAIAVAKRSGRVGSVGYCWGGAMSYVAACELSLACAVVYYGKVSDYLDRKPKCPVMYHFGKQDQSIPQTDVQKVKAAQPQGIFFDYDAGHGFNCDQRSSYDPAAAAQARQRTLDFFARHLAHKSQTAEQ
jgi:carboxymethylenebutenolidase